MATLSLMSMPSMPSGALKSMPKSLRLRVPLAEKPARVIS